MTPSQTEHYQIYCQDPPIKRAASQYELSFSQFDVEQIVIFSKEKGVDKERYLSSIKQALKSFRFLFFRFDAQQLLMDDRSLCVFEYMSTSAPLEFQLNNLIPNKNTNGMLSIKLTEGTNHFSIGCMFNHALLDQSGILRFLSEVSILYNNQFKSKTIDLHVLNSSKQPTPGDMEIFTTIENYTSIANRFGKIHKSLHPMKDYPILTDDHPKFKLSLNIPKSSLRKLQVKWSETNLKISTNDIINSILIVLAAHDKKLMKYGPLECQFPMNIRNKLGLSSSHIGNYFLSIWYTEDELKKHAQALDIKALSRVIKQKVLSANPEDFNNLIYWHATLNRRNELSSDYISRFQHNPAMVQTTNWTNFDYDSIALEQAKFIEITQAKPFYFRPYLCPITMKVKDNEIIYTCNLSTLSDMTHTVEAINLTFFDGSILL
jgi:hypothetical protein